MTGDPVITLSTHVSALVPEIQRLTTSATLRFAEQSIAVRALGSGLPRAFVPEVQVLSVFNASGGGFSLKLRNYSTPLIPYGATAAITRQAILDHIKFLSDVTVSRRDVGSGHRQFSITFTSHSGDLPLLQSNASHLLALSGMTPSVSVAEQTPGTVQEVQTISFPTKPLGGHFALTYGGETTTPLLHNASAKALQSALEELHVLGRVLVSQGNSSGANIPSWTVTFVDVTGDLPLLGTVSNLWAGNTVSHRLTT